MPPQHSTIAARCAALSTSIAQVIPDIASFARKVRDARHDLNEINHDLVVIRTGLGIAQDDFSSSAAKLPSPLVDALSQILDSCDNASERLHKAFLKLSCSTQPKIDWQILKNGPLASMRQDLEGSKMVLELAIDYLALYGSQDSLESFLERHVSERIAISDELLKRTDTDEIEVNLIARDRLPSLLHAIRLLRSCITAVSRDVKANVNTPIRRTTTPRPDSLEPGLGEERRSLRESASLQTPTPSSASKSIGTWLADIPVHDDAQPLRHSRIMQISSMRKEDHRNSKRMSRAEMTPSRGTFYTDDGVTSNRTLTAPEPRLKKTKSWCSGVTLQYATHSSSKSKKSSRYAPTVASSNVSIIHKRLTSDKIAVAKGNRKNLEPPQRVAVDRILANIPSDATAVEVERILWEGANPMLAHPEFGYFFIRAAHEMSLDVLHVLIEFGADIEKISPSPKNHYYSAMHAAALGKQFDTVKFLVSRGHSIDTTNTCGETPLLSAVKTPGAFRIAQYFVEKGADVNHESDNGETPLYVVLTSKNLEGGERSRLIELLLSNGAEKDEARDVDSRRGDSKGRMVLGLT